MKHTLQPISMAVQKARLQQAYPGSRASLKRDVLCWVADLTPTPLSRIYRVKLKMHKDGKPEVRLIHPTLQTRDGEQCPHLYPGGVLCLYLPGAFEWTREMLLVGTVVPWISEWLAHYEVWHATGVWTGGGVHPETKNGRSRTLTPTRNGEAAHSHRATSTPIPQESDGTLPVVETNAESIAAFLDRHTPVHGFSESETHNA
jgi:hypothetical protein